MVTLCSYGRRLSRHCIALWAMLGGLVGPIWAADGSGSPSSNSLVPFTSQAAAAEQMIDFNIPAQPLVSALDRFAVISGRSVLFSSTLATGRTASLIRGRYVPIEALRLLLEGTGLAAEEVATGMVVALVIKPASPQALANAAAARAAAEDNLRDFDGLLQASVWAVLCADPRTAQRDYQSLLRFEIDPSGQVQQVRLLGSTGNRQRDVVLVENLSRATIGRPPPPDLRQPVTLLIQPGQDGSTACNVAGA